MQKKKLRLDDIHVNSFVTSDTSNSNEVVGGTSGYYDTMNLDCRTVGIMCNPPESGRVDCIIGIYTVEYDCPTGGWGGGGYSCNVNNC